jgi:hypothetical protein
MHRPQPLAANASASAAFDFEGYPLPVESDEVAPQRALPAAPAALLVAVGVLIYHLVCYVFEVANFHKETGAGEEKDYQEVQK